MSDEYLKREYTADQKCEILWAIEYAAKAAGHRFAYETDRDISLAINSLTEFVNKAKPAPEHDEKTAAASRAMHTYLRKCCDSAITTLLHYLVSNNTGRGVWHALCKGVYEHVNDKVPHPHDIMDCVERYHDENDELVDNTIVFYVIKAWWEQNNHKDFMRMIKEFKKNDWLKNS